MKAILILFFILMLNHNVFSQKSNSILNLGTYNTINDSHNNRHHFEELILKNDSTFEYNARLSEFVKVQKVGSWSVSRDTLILKEKNPKFPAFVQVKEHYKNDLPKNQVKIDVLTTEDQEIIYQVSVTHLDTTILVENVIKEVFVPLRLADKIIIATGLYIYPRYYPKKSESNVFEFIITIHHSLMKNG